MKMKKKLAVIGILLLFVCNFSLLAFAAERIGKTRIEATYECGSLFEVPAGATLVIPGSGEERTGNVELDSEGIYTLKYEDGKTETFTVKKKLFAVSDSKSSVSWGTYKASEHDPENYGVSGEVTGWQVALAAGDTFTYNKVINLKDKTREELLLEFALTPNTLGKKDVSQFDVILTDAYNPEMQMTIRVNPSVDKNNAGDEMGLAYLKAGVYGSLVGKEWWNPSNQVVHKDDPFGAVIFLSFSGVTRYGDALDSISRNVFSISYDDAEKQLFAMHNTEFSSNAGNPMVDFDSEEYFDKLWEGFTTGECFLSIKASASSGSGTFHFVLTDVGGEKLTSVLDESRPAPRIEIDYGGYAANDLPIALIGTRYPLFEATCASPYYGVLEVAKSVTFNGEPVAVTENSFVPERAGNYTVTYSVTDPFGEVTEKSVTVTAFESEENNFTIKAKMSFDAPLTAGDLLSILAPEIKGQSGRADWRATVTHGGNTEEIVGDTYRVPAPGDYILTFIATDYVGRKVTDTVSFSVEPGDCAIFTDTDISLPKYFLNGKSYELPEVWAYNFTDGSGAAIPSKAYIEDSTGRRISRNNRVTPLVENIGDTVKIIFVAEIANGVPAELEFDGIPVLSVRDDSGAFSFDKFFQVTEGNAELTRTKDSVRLDADDSKVSTDFINPLLANSFSVTFVPGGAMKKVSVILTNCEDLSQRVKFTYALSGTTTHFYINDVETLWYDVGRIFAGTEFTLTYSAQTKRVSFRTGKINVSVPKTLDGSDYDFYGKKVYMTVVAEGDESGVAKFLDFKYVCGQVISSDRGEYIDPIIHVDGDYGGRGTIGSVALVGKAVAVDVVDPSVAAVVTVKSPSGKTVRALDGTLLDAVSADNSYEISLSEYGQYVVSYVASDESGNTRAVSYSITVMDSTAPEITLKGNVPVRGKAGEQLILPDADVTDDISADISLHITVFTNHGKILALDSSTRAFTPQSAGVYRVIYWAIDESGNMQTLEYNITVQ